MQRTALLIATALASAAAAGSAHADGVTASVSPEAHPRFALMTDVGVPDAGVASLVYRPLRAVQLHAGVGYNAISPGVRAGITIAPLPWWFTPTLSFDYGRYFEGDANPLARRVSGDDEFHSDMLERVGYDYANGHLGLQFGQRRVSFYLRAGVSRITGNIRNLESVTGGMDEASTSVAFTEDPHVELWSVSAKLGLVVYFLK